MKFSKCLACLFIIAFFNYTFIYAAESSNINSIEANEIENIEDEKIEEQKANLKKEVLNLVEELRIGISSIDEKIESLRKTDEYSTYPTIRLNIDTPVLGIKSIINQKLRITKDVSAGDVAKGYSVRDIVKNKIVKVPDLKVGNIVVSVKELDLESDLLVSEYNSLILKLINYKDKVQSVENFLDIQTNKIFKEYVSKEKKDKLGDFSSRLEKINEDLLNVNNDLSKMYFNESEEYSELKEEYIKLTNLQKELKKETTNVLIESDDLNSLQKNIIGLESNVVDYLAKVDNLIDIELKEIKINEIYIKSYNNLKSKLEYIEKYIENSKTEKDISTENNIDNNSTKNISDENVKTTEIEIVYEVFSDKSVNNMKNILSNIEKRMNELDIKYNETKENEETDIENNVDDKEIKEQKYEKLTSEEIENEFSNVIQKYNEFLKYEYTFYLDNINGLLNITNVKLKDISSVTDIDIIDEAKYIYIDLPVNLDKYLDTYDINSSVEIRYLISNLKNELKKLCNNYLNLIELYDKLNVDELLNKA